MIKIASSAARQSGIQYRKIQKSAKKEYKRFLLKKYYFHIWLGQKGEKDTIKYYQKNDFYIWQSNWRHKLIKGELDIIAYKDNRLHFIEVKSRMAKKTGIKPLDSVGYKKEKQLNKLVELFWRRNRRQCMLRRIRSFQIDLVGIEYQKNTLGIIKPVSFLRIEDF